MLPSKERLNKQDFTLLSKDKSVLSVFNTLGTLKYRPNSKKAFSIVISSKIAKKAVDRNRIKRRIYTLIQKSDKLAIFTGILYISKNTPGLSYEQTKDLFNNLIAKIK